MDKKLHPIEMVYIVVFVAMITLIVIGLFGGVQSEAEVEFNNFDVAFSQCVEAGYSREECTSYALDYVGE